MLPLIKAAPKVPSLVEVSPEYAALFERWSLLGNRFQEAIVELRAQSEPALKPRAWTAEETIADVERRRRVDALLKGEKYEARPVALLDPQPQSRYWELQREITDI